MTPPILCTGNELAGVLAGIRERGGFVASLDTGVGGKNANYSVSYLPNRSQHSEPEWHSLPPGCPKVEFLPPKQVV
jgi:hypothetical protein